MYTKVSRSQYVHIGYIRYCCIIRIAFVADL